MKVRHISLIATLLLLAGLTSTHGQIDVVKGNNTTSLVTGTSWIGGSVPGIFDIAVFDDTYAQTGTLGTGAPLNYGGLRIEGTTVTDEVWVNNTTYNNFIGLGDGGLDMSAAPRDLRIVGFVANTNQTWNIGAGRTFTVGGTRFSGAGDIDITGDGLVILNADNGGSAYAGTLSVSGGTLRLNALEAGDVTINDGGILDSEAYLPGNLALGSATGAGLLIDASNTAVLDVGDLVLNGTNTVYLTSLPATPGTVNVVNYQLITGDETNFALDPAVVARLRNAPVFADDVTAITLEFLAGDDLTWTGATSGDWNFNTTANWSNGAPATFFDFDSVSFGDSAANKTVSITGEVAPLSTSFTNTAGNDYTIGGPAGIGGAGSLSIAGSGTVTLTNTNTFTGPTTIEDGTLVVDITAGDPLAETSDVTINSPGTLRLVHDDAGFDIQDAGLTGDGTVGINPHNAVGSIDNLSVTLSGDNSAFTGTLLLEEPLSGTWRVNQPGPAALGGASVTVENGAQLWADNDTYSSPLTLTGDGFADTDGPLGALRMTASTLGSGGTKWDGPVTITGTPGDSGGTTHDASIGFNAGASGNYYAFVNGPIGGGDLGIVSYSGNGSELLYLTNANSYGDSLVHANDLATAGQVQFIIGGTANTSATLGTGDVHLIGGAGGKVATLRIQRDDGYLLPGDVLAGGNTAATRIIIDTIGAGVTTNGRTINIGEELRVSANVNDSVLNIDPGSVVTCGALHVGNSNNRPGTLNQTGGDVVVLGDLAVARGTNQTSSYNMSGGTLDVAGVIYAGVGGSGILNLDGGTVTVSSAGIAGTAGGAVNLGGTTLLAGAGFTSTVPITITAPSTIDIDGNFVQLQAGITGDGNLTLADTAGFGSLFLTYDNDSTYNGALSGATTVIKDGFGTLTLGGASSHTGDFAVDEGGLLITGSLNGSNLSFDGGTLHTGGSLTGELSIGTLANSSIAFTGSPLAVTGNVSLSGVNEVNPLSTGALAAGSYPMITYSGTLSGDSSNLSLPLDFVPTDYRQSFSFAAAGGSIDLVVTGDTADLVWDGSVSTTWDINMATAWDGGSGVFYNLDEALFDDTAASGTVDIPGLVGPESVTVNNETVAFTFGGTGSIDGSAALTKQGSGTLTINNSNAYTGGTTVEGGTLQANAADATGTGPVLIAGGGQVTVDAIGALGSETVTISDGKLRVNVKNALTNDLVLGDSNSGTAETVVEYELASAASLDMPTVVSGNAPDSKAIIRVIGPGGVAGQSATYFSGSIMLDGRDLYHDNAAGRIGGLSGKISGTGDLHITETPGSGNNRTRLLNNSNDFVGDIYVDGTAYLQIGTGSPSGTVTSVPTGSDVIIGPDAIVRATGSSCYIGALRGDGNMSLSVSGSGTFAKRLYLGTGDKSGTYNGTCTDGTYPLALTKTGTGTQVLNGDCTFTGSTIVSGGVLEINSSTYDSAVTVYTDATLAGTGTLAGSLTATQLDAIVAPGASTGTLAVNGNANLGGGTLAIEIDDAATPQNDRLDVGGTLTLTNGALDVVVTGSAGQNAYIIASYGTLVGEFAVETIPAGYEVDYNYLFANQVAIKVIGGSDYDTWAANFGLAGPEAAPGADPDGDSVSNEDEYAFGLDPTSAASATPVSTGIDKTAGTFTYTRRDPALTGLSYAVESSTTLEADSWVPDLTAVQDVIDTVGEVQTVEVTLTGAPLGDPKIFARVTAQ